MPGFDKEIAKLAQRILINPRKIDYHTGVLATKVTPGAAHPAVPDPVVGTAGTRLCSCDTPKSSIATVLSTNP